VKSQQNLAKISGFRDWHELTQVHQENHVVLTLSQDDERQLAIDLTLSLSDELDIEWSTALYAITKSHIVGVNLSSLKEYNE